MLRHTFLFAVLFVIFSSWNGARQVVFQNGQPRPNGPANQNRYKITGMVVNSITGEPIVRAVVRINGSTNQQMFTDGSGRFEASDVPEGQIAVTAQRPGFVNSQINHSLQMITVGPSTPSIEVKLMPEGVIKGKITNNEGEPVEGMGLQVMFQQINNGRKDWLPRGGAQTDENGEYEIEDLPPGQYLIHTSTRAVFFVNAPSQGSPYTDVYPAQFFPNAPDRSSAQPVTVGAGQAAEADFRLSPVPSYSITGTVSGPQNVTVMCEDEEGN
ncbi:MAG: carboxypeptidase regulatory-like domain-containing protein, partial [Acidobacteriaceae bacterium]|nr:carboxypeptidase regulatory-like domain-containing protein [Acidobacteriaceae bacterium]